MSSHSSAATAGPSLTGRIAAAIALTIAFYLLALIIGVGLIALPIIGWANGTGNVWLTVTMLVLGGSVLWAIVPRRNQFHPPGLKLTEAAAPGLLRMIREEAEAGDEPVPEDVYATMEVNAAVTQASGGRRVLIVGLSLVNQLTERELRGVLAHEFGHYRGGDLTAGRVIWRTRQAIIRTINQLSDDDGDDSWSQRAVRLPFIWYGTAFMRITAAISRRQEFAADRCAVERVGRDAYASALRKVHGDAAAFDAYWGQEVVPVLEAGRRPPVAEGFIRFMANEGVKESTQAFVEDTMQRKTDPYDSHPSLAERLAAIEDLPAGEPDESAPAISLISEPDVLERRVLQDLIGDRAGQYTPVTWDEVGVEVYGQLAHERAKRFPEVLDGVTIGTMPAAIEQLSQTAHNLRDPDTDQEYAEDVVATILADGMLLALERAGWTLEAPPAEPVSAHREEHGLIPSAAVYALRQGETSPEQWRQDMGELGVAELPLEAQTPAETTA